MESDKPDGKVPEEPFSQRDGYSDIPGFADSAGVFRPQSPRQAFEESEVNYRRLSEIERVRAIVAQGLPLSVLKAELGDIGLTLAQLEAADFIPKDFFAGAGEDQIVHPDHLRRILRIVRFVRRAQATIGQSDRIMFWLKQPFEDFDDLTGFQLLKSEEGGAVLFERLEAIDHGMFA